MTHKLTSMGIDPGVEGYLCRIERTPVSEDPATKAVTYGFRETFWPMPVRDGDRAGEGDDLDDGALLDILHSVGPDLDILVVEAQQGYPGSGARCPVCRKPKVMQGVASTFKTGLNFGVIKGVALALGLPLRVVEPGEWKPVWGLNADKSLSVAKAQLLAPTVDFRQVERAKSPKRCRTPDHNKAESYILARHGFRLLAEPQHRSKA